MEPSPSYCAAKARTVSRAASGVSDRCNRRAYFGHPRTIGCNKYKLATNGRDHQRICHGGNSTLSAATVAIPKLASTVNTGNGHSAGQTVASSNAPTVNTACHSKLVNTANMPLGSGVYNVWNNALPNVPW